MIHTEDNGRERKDGGPRSVPERALALAVILEALLDLETVVTGCQPAGEYRSPELTRDEAQSFFFAGGAWSKAFEAWCDLADLEPDYIRKRARAILDGAPLNTYGARHQTRECREPAAPAPVSTTARPGPMRPDTTRAVAILKDIRRPIAHRLLAEKVGVHHAALTSVLAAAIGRGVPIVKTVLEGRPFYVYRPEAAAPETV